MSSRRKYEIEGDNDKVVVITLKKWSMRKTLSLLREVSEITTELGIDITDIETTGFAPIIDSLATASEKAVGRIANVIRTSVVTPTLTEDEILDWGLDDFSGVVAEIIEQNINDKLLKNFARLKGSPLGRALTPRSIATNRVAAEVAIPKTPPETNLTGGFQAVPLHLQNNGNAPATP